jgi:hypothetical protein
VHAGQDDGVQRLVGAAVAAADESVTTGPPGGGWDRRGAAQVGEGGFGSQLLRVVAGGGEQLAGDVGADAEQLE